QLETLHKFSQKFAPYGFSSKRFCSAYGMSELAGLIAASRYGKKPKSLSLEIEALKNNKAMVTKQAINSSKLIGCGRLLQGLQVKVVKPETLTVLPEMNIGEIWLAGSAVAAGYWQRLTETEEFFGATLPGDQPVYFKTGDLGFIYKGEIFLTG